MLSSIQNAQLYNRANSHFKAGEFAQAAPLFAAYLAAQKEDVATTAKPGSKRERAQMKLAACLDAPAVPAHKDAMASVTRPRAPRSQTAPGLAISAPYNVHKPFTRFDPGAVWPERSLPASPRTPLAPRSAPNAETIGMGITTEARTPHKDPAAVNAAPNTSDESRRLTLESAKSWQSTSEERAWLAEVLESETHRAIVARRAPASLQRLPAREL